MAVLHFGRFTSAVGAALAVIELSALSKSSVSLLKTSGGLHSSPAEAPLPQFCLGGRAIKLYSAALERLTINAFTKKKKKKFCELHRHHPSGSIAVLFTLPFSAHLKCCPMYGKA